MGQNNLSIKLAMLPELIRMGADDHIEKVTSIVETGLWSEPELRDAAELIQQGGADFIKTCLGTGPRGVSERDVELLYQTVGDRIGIKAPGGIKTGTQARRFLQLGATRLRG